jgi:regulator of sigma E protease
MSKLLFSVSTLLLALAFNPFAGLQTFLAFILLISVMVLFHELGHFWAARYFDIKVDAFSIGFGPSLLHYQWGETDWRLSAIPFGGYVKMVGETPEDVSDDPRAFQNKPRWQRIIVAIAGPLMNILLALLLMTILYMNAFPRVQGLDSKAVLGHVEKDSPAAKAGLAEGDTIVRIDNSSNPTWEDVLLKQLTGAGRVIPLEVLRGDRRFSTSLTPKAEEKTGAGYAGWSGAAEMRLQEVSAGSGAEAAGLKSGDVLLSADGQTVRSIERLHELLKAGNGKPIEVVYSRSGQWSKVQVQPKFNEDLKRWLMGVSLVSRVVSQPLPFGEALKESWKENIRQSRMIFSFLGGLFGGRMSARSLEGPIGIAKRAGEAMKEGPLDYLGLMSAVSINLAIFNLLPLPVLDGGMILMLLIESIRRKDLSLTLKENIMKVGLVFLLSLAAFVIYNDLTKS